MHTDHSQANTTILVFAILNFVGFAVSVLWLILLAVVLCYGIFFSGDTGSELAAGVGGTAMLALPCLVESGVLLLAGVGLMKRRPWGYWFHIVGAALAALTCVGLVYTVVALVFALRPEFSSAFSPQPSKATTASGVRV